MEHIKQETRWSKRLILLALICTIALSGGFSATIEFEPRTDLLLLVLVPGTTFLISGMVLLISVIIYLAEDKDKDCKLKFPWSIWAINAIFFAIVAYNLVIKVNQ